MGLGGWVIYEGPSIHNMSGLSGAIHVHVLGRHVHCINHYGFVMSWRWLCWLPSFTHCVFIGLECVIVSCFGVLGYIKAFCVWVGASGE